MSAIHDADLYSKNTIVASVIFFCMMLYQVAQQNVHLPIIICSPYLLALLCHTLSHFCPVESYHFRLSYRKINLFRSLVYHLDIVEVFEKNDKCSRKLILIISNCYWHFIDIYSHNLSMYNAKFRNYLFSLIRFHDRMNKIY